MATRNWSKIAWKNDGTDNDLIREFLADPDVIRKCDACPYKMEHPSYDNTTLWTIPLLGRVILLKARSRGEICGSLFLSLKEMLVCNA